MPRKKEACEYCESEIFTSIGEGHQLAVEWYPFNGYIGVSSYCNNTDDDSEMALEYIIPLNYCPVCGRKLS